MNDNTNLEEIEYLQNPLEIIKELIDEKGDSIENKITEINELKKYIWENTGQVDEAEIETNIYNANAQVDYTNEEISEIQKLKKAYVSPYFGRIDFTPTLGGKKERKVYIGITGVSKGYKFYVYDWRTSIASLFYNFGTGKGYYDAPRGRIEGNISLKRQYKIINGEIIRCFDSDINIDDEFLQEILSKASSEKMTNIVNTIQKEQNQIIRNITDRHLIVQGVAGSGKTSVALHRIAYLLFQEKKLTSNNILIFSPNNVFSEYICNVLPELGEKNVLETTFDNFAKRYIGKNKNIESFTEFIERYYKDEKINGKEHKIAEYKLSRQFKQLLDQKIEEYKNKIYFSGSLIIDYNEISANELDIIYKQKYKRLPLPERIDAMVEYICDSYGLPYYKYKASIKRKLNSLIKNNFNFYTLYNQIISSDEFIENTENSKPIRLDTKKIKYEDLINLIYINFELNGYPTDRSIKHVVIDEVQDYTLLQLEVLKKIFCAASFTILGDINQNINPYYSYESLNEINKVFSNEGKYIELNKTYRSSQEIIEFTNKILDISNVCSIRQKSSVPVESKEVNEQRLKCQFKLDIDDMEKTGIGKIAIITKNESQTMTLYDLLKEEIKEIFMINDNSNNKIGKIVILPSYIAKGLEFDAVIAYNDINNPYTENEKNLYYVVCTRAQHRLIIYNQPDLNNSKVKTKKKQ